MLATALYQGKEGGWLAIVAGSVPLRRSAPRLSVRLSGHGMPCPYGRIGEGG